MGIPRKPPPPRKLIPAVAHFTTEQLTAISKQQKENKEHKQQRK